MLKSINVFFKQNRIFYFRIFLSTWIIYDNFTIISLYFLTFSNIYKRKACMSFKNAPFVLHACMKVMQNAVRVSKRNQACKSIG